MDEKERTGGFGRGRKKECSVVVVVVWEWWRGGREEGVEGEDREGKDKRHVILEMTLLMYGICFFLITGPSRRTGVTESGGLRGVCLCVFFGGMGMWKEGMCL